MIPCSKLRGNKLAFTHTRTWGQWCSVGLTSSSHFPFGSQISINAGLESWKNSSWFCSHSSLWDSQDLVNIEKSPAPYPPQRPSLNKQPLPFIKDITASPSLGLRPRLDHVHSQNVTTLQHLLCPCHRLFTFNLGCGYCMWQPAAVTRKSRLDLESSGIPGSMLPLLRPCLCVAASDWPVCEAEVLTGVWKRDTCLAMCWFSDPFTGSCGQCLWDTQNMPSHLTQG